MDRVVITRKQFEKLREIFDQYDTLDHVVYIEDHTAGGGIGSATYVEFNPKSVKVDITDVSSW